MTPPIKTLSQYFEESTIVNDCLIHPSAKARIIYKRRHEVELTKEQYVCHRCDEPYCILDDHHFIGSCRDNIIDSVLKGRHY